MSDKLDLEIERVHELTRGMLAEYSAWGGKIKNGEVHYTSYYDMLDYLNYRMETVDTCLLLLENGKVADALGLCRSLLENYLLFILMCRGYKFVKVRDLSALSEPDFKKELREERKKLSELHASGNRACLEVKRAPRISRRLMYVFEGLKSSEEPDYMTPAYYFHFREFYPEQLRLKDEDYFQYYEPPAETKQAVREFRAEADLRYRFYLSYYGLLDCLELNGIIDDPLIARIEAHYTFLGKFLHPTHNAARELRERSNVYTNRTEVGSAQPYAATAKLLAELYVCYLATGLLDEAAGLFEGAPAEHVAEPGTADLRRLVDSVPKQFPYFWFLFNDPPLHARYEYCIHHATDEELAEWGHYSNVPLERVPFNQHIHSQLQQALSGWSNLRCGEYLPPIA